MGKARRVTSANLSPEAWRGADTGADPCEGQSPDVVRSRMRARLCALARDLALERRYLDLHEPEDRKLLSLYAAEKKPRDIWSSPACTPFAPIQNVNIEKKRNAGHRRWRPAGERVSLELLEFLKKLHKANVKRAGRSHHEQSAASRAPCDGGIWPWAISSDFGVNAQSVAGCAVGLTDHMGQKPLAKQWRVESTSAALLEALSPYKCSGGHEHGIGLGNLERTAAYTPFFCTLVAEVLLET